MVSLRRFPTSNPPPQASSSQTPAGNAEPGPSARSLDILFLQDSTGSQGPYIQAARRAIHDICTRISASTALGSQGAIRFGLIAFRDHPPQDNSFVTKNFGFTGDVGAMKKSLDSLIASGGGDGPEASTAALAEALNMGWAERAVKIVVLITDAPPHGLGEDGDGFKESPDQNDPLEIVRQMAERGITLYVIACEPTLSQYKHAVDFYRALTQITSGRMVPLVNATKLGEYIVGSALETMETEQLIGEFEHTILEDVYGQGKSVEEVMETIQKELSKKKVRINTLHVEEIYEPSEQAQENVQMWRAAGSLLSARGGAVPLSEPRIKKGYFGQSARPAAVSVAPQAIDQAQTKRVVMQSLMRSSKVGAGGVLTPTGTYAGKPSALSDVGRK